MGDAASLLWRLYAAAPLDSAYPTLQIDSWGTNANSPAPYGMLGKKVSLWLLSVEALIRLGVPEGFTDAQIGILDIVIES